VPFILPLPFIDKAPIRVIVWIREVRRVRRVRSLSKNSKLLPPPATPISKEHSRIYLRVQVQLVCLLELLSNLEATPPIYFKSMIDRRRSRLLSRLMSVEFHSIIPLLHRCSVIRSQKSLRRNRSNQHIKLITVKREVRGWDMWYRVRMYRRRVQLLIEMWVRRGWVWGRRVRVPRCTIQVSGRVRTAISKREQAIRRCISHPIPAKSLRSRSWGWIKLFSNSILSS
jgi:hypothetical protein